MPVTAALLVLLAAAPVPPVHAELGAGLWWSESAARSSIALASPSVAVAWEPRSFLRVDARYRIAFVKEGSPRVGYLGTLQALEPRVHAVLRRGRFAATLGIGPVATLATGVFLFGSTRAKVKPVVAGGGTAVLGLEVTLGRVPVRLEAGVATENARVSGLASVAIALPFAAAPAK